jgi:hypothetical protein
LAVCTLKKKLIGWLLIFIVHIEVFREKTRLPAKGAVLNFKKKFCSSVKMSYPYSVNTSKPFHQSKPAKPPKAIKKTSPSSGRACRQGENCLRSFPNP